MEGNMRGPSSQDCEKSFVRTGVETAGMSIHREARLVAGLVQIRNSTERPHSPQAV
jgi:hypothetical protein